MHLRCSTLVTLSLQVSSAVLCASQRSLLRALAQSRALGGAKVAAGAGRCMQSRHSAPVLSLHAWISLLRDSQCALSFALAQSMGWAPGLSLGAVPVGIAASVVVNVAAGKASRNTTTDHTRD